MIHAMNCLQFIYHWTTCQDRKKIKSTHPVGNWISVFTCPPLKILLPEENTIPYYMYCSSNRSHRLYYNLLIIAKWVRPKLHYSTFNAEPDTE